MNKAAACHRPTQERTTNERHPHRESCDDITTHSVGDLLPRASKTWSRLVVSEHRPGRHDLLGFDVANLDLRVANRCIRTRPPRINDHVAKLSSTSSKTLDGKVHSARVTRSERTLRLQLIQRHDHGQRITKI